MEDPYACTICWRRLSEPIVLNCGHSFDRECVKSLKSCPICRSEILTRSTNWQLISILERREPKDSSSSEEAELKDDYILINNWSGLSRGTMIRYSLNAKKSRVRYGWFVSFNLDDQIVQMQVGRGKLVRLPLEYIKEAFYHPGLFKDTIEYEAACCNLL